MTKPTQFVAFDLGDCVRGDWAEVALTAPANVRLVTTENLRAYQQRKEHRYVGGRANSSPVRLPIPSNGRWHVVVDLEGPQGPLRAAARRVPLGEQPSESADADFQQAVESIDSGLSKALDGPPPESR